MHATQGCGDGELHRNCGGEWDGSDEAARARFIRNPRTSFGARVIPCPSSISWKVTGEFTLAQISISMGHSPHRCYRSGKYAIRCVPINTLSEQAHMGR